jgi:hypothetical protein
MTAAAASHTAARTTTARIRSWAGIRMADGKKTVKPSFCQTTAAWQAAFCAPAASGPGRERGKSLRRTRGTNGLRHELRAGAMS